MSKNPIKDEIDFLIAQSQNETDISKEIVKSIREKGDYYEEKLALKMLDFFQTEEKLVALYAEAKKNYPMLAKLMENKKPYLLEMLAEAKKLYEKEILGR